MVGGKISGFAGRLRGLDDEPLLARIAVPTLVLFGQYDIMTRSSQQGVVQQLRNGSIFEIPEAGHMAQFDQPDAWRGAIRQFLAAHD
jgi:pimeloyl-ACP methyl ester carboxylesterase